MRCEDVNELVEHSNYIEQIPINNLRVLKNLCDDINQSIQGIRPIMYSDIINIIIRKRYTGECYNQLILWCNFNIRKGKDLVEI